MSVYRVRLASIAVVTYHDFDFLLSFTLVRHLIITVLMGGIAYLGGLQLIPSQGNTYRTNHSLG